MSNRAFPVGHPDRETAARWASLYRKALAAPNGEFTEYDDSGERLFTINATDVEPLVELLERLARFGTLSDKSGDAIGPIAEKLMMRLHFDKLRTEEGLSIERALDRLEDEYRTMGRGYSRSSIQRILGMK
jgi:hypothetical protein